MNKLLKYIGGYRSSVLRTRLVALLLLLPATGGLLAGEGSGSPAEVAAPQTAEQWLARLGPALNMTSYRGVFVYARGDQVSSMRIAHRYRDGMVEERLVMQDGSNGEIVRKGMEVICVLPDHGRVQLDQVIPSGPFAEAFANQLMPLNRWYRPELVGNGRVAGYEAVTVDLGARDEFRYGYRLWLEKNTGLMLKSQVRDRDGEVLEHFQFTSLEISDQLPDSEFQVQTQGEGVTRQLSDAPQASRVARMSGWELGWQPEGFVAAAVPRSGRGQAVAFSDGIAAFSVFVDPVGAITMPTGASRIGATTAYMKQLTVGNTTFLVTVVGEIPPLTARRVAESVTIDDAVAFRLDKP